MGWLAGRRNEVRRLKQRLLGGDVAIEQQDGSTFTIDRMQAHIQCFTYLYESMAADCDVAPRPEPPPVLVAVANAEDRLGALYKVVTQQTNLPIDSEVLVEEGRFEPVSMVHGVSYEGLIARGGVPDLSEP